MNEQAAVHADEIVFSVCQEDGRWLARWDDPSGKGGIVTDAGRLAALEEAMREVLYCHFDDEVGAAWKCAMRFA